MNLDLDNIIKLLAVWLGLVNLYILECFPVREIMILNHKVVVKVI